MGEYYPAGSNSGFLPRGRLQICPCWRTARVHRGEYFEVALETSHYYLTNWRRLPEATVVDTSGHNPSKDDTPCCSAVPRGGLPGSSGKTSYVSPCFMSLMPTFFSPDSICDTAPSPCIVRTLICMGSSTP